MILWLPLRVRRRGPVSNNASTNRGGYVVDQAVKLEEILRDFVNAYNFARRLKSLRGLTP
jgi:hypothetical protein